MRKFSLALASLIFSAHTQLLWSQAPPKMEMLAEDRPVGGKTLDQWIKDLRDRDPAVKTVAIQTLARYGFSAHKAVPVLVSALKDRDPSIRTNAIIALGKIGMEKKDAANGLAAMGQCLNDSEQVVRYWAATALGGYGFAANGSLQNLIAAAKDYRASWEVRKAAVGAIGLICRDQPSVPRVLQVLREMFKDVCAQVRSEALKAVILIGKPSSPQDLQFILPAVRGMIGDHDKTVQIWAQVALMRLERVTEEHVHAITTSLKASDSSTRIQAATALQNLGIEHADLWLNDLRDALGDKDPDVVFAVLRTLMDLGPAAKEALPDVQKVAAGSKEETIRKAAESTAAAISGSAKARSAPPAK
jgi:HEAT repeat protein